MPKKNSKETKKEKVSEEEFEKKVIELAEKGLTCEKIGEILRKQGIHPKEYKKISGILKEKKMYTEPNLKNIEEKFERIKAHYEKNKQDKRAKREVDRMSALVRKAKIYYKR
jgi:ribosomal protein S15P/S13E